MPAVTRIGDADVTHCSGMTRAAGSGNVFANGIGISRQGDSNTTHLLPPNIPPCPCSRSWYQLLGRQLLKVIGKGCGRVGDGISGCTSVAAGSGNVFAGG